MRGTWSVFGLVVLLSMANMPGLAGEPVPPEHAPCGDDTDDLRFLKMTRTVGDEEVHACLVMSPNTHQQLGQFPAFEEPVTLVVMAHGFGHTVQGSWMGHASEVVLAHPDVVVLAPNYRDNFGFPILGGAQDLIHFTEVAQATFGPTATILYTVSMGSSIGGTALHEADPGMFDLWISLEGAHNPIETYFEARALAPGIAFAKTAQDGIERDAGGSFEEVPEAYVRRAPVMNAEAIVASGIQGAVFIHGVNDGLVPYDQSVEMVGALAALDLPLEFTTVLRHDPAHTSGTTPTSHAGQPQHDPNEQVLGLAGHGSEADRGHIIVDLGMQRLHEVLDGIGVGPGQHLLVYDEGTGPVSLK